MRAAVRAGADAVYFGLQGFNARARAHNFDADELSATMSELHASGVRGYVTLNTLVFDAELPSLEAAVRACAEAGVDAVIVQDLGVARLVRAIAPDAAHPRLDADDLHRRGRRSSWPARVGAHASSSRASCRSRTSPPSARRPTYELEVFVHGALCIAYSGQCLTSEAIGGRSANRGACAQACRLPYELVVDGALRDLGDRAYLLSPEDLEASALVPELCALGVSSLKIEGRLKGPEYVAATTALYRAAIDGAADDAATQRARAADLHPRLGPGLPRAASTTSASSRAARATTAGSRSAPPRASCASAGATGRRVKATTSVAKGDGLLVEGGWGGEGEVGGRVWEVEATAEGQTRWSGSGPDERVGGGRPGPPRLPDERSARTTRRRVRSSSESRRASPLDVTLSGRDRRAVRAVGDERARALARACVAEAPRRARPNSRHYRARCCEDKLGRLGDTPFALASLTVDLPEGAMIPMSALNRARRALADALAPSDPRAARDRPRISSTPCSPRPSRRTAPRRLPVCSCSAARSSRRTPRSTRAPTASYLDFLELTGTGAALRALRARCLAASTSRSPRRASASRARRRSTATCSTSAPTRCSCARSARCTRPRGPPSRASATSPST